MPMRQPEEYQAMAALEADELPTLTPEERRVYVEHRASELAIADREAEPAERRR